MDGRLFITVMVMIIFGHETFADEENADPELVSRILNIKEVNDILDLIGGNYLLESMVSSAAEGIQKSYKDVRSRINKQKEHNAALMKRIKSAGYDIQHSEEIMSALEKQSVALTQFEKSVRGFIKSTSSIRRRTKSMKAAMETATERMNYLKNVINVYLVSSKGSPVPGNPCILNRQVCGEHGKCSYGEAFFCECTGFYGGTYCDKKTVEECTAICPFRVGGRKSKCVIYDGLQTCECPSRIIADLSCVTVPGSNEYYGPCRMNCGYEEEEEEP